MRAPTDAQPALRLSWIVLAIGAVAFVALAATLIPWHPYPGGAVTAAPEAAYFTPAQLARINDFSTPARWLSRSALAVGLVVACLLGFTRARTWLTARLRGPWPLRVVEAVAVVTLVGQLATLPLMIALQRHAVAFGLSRQSWPSWLQDELLNWLVTVVGASLAIVALLVCTRMWPRIWPVVAGLILAGLVLLGSFVYPVLVQPLFTSLSPMPDGPLRTQVLALARTEGVHVDDVLVADASRRTTALNAYVTGFGPTRRVVIYDTMLAGTSGPAGAMRRRELLSVVAHELTHAKHDDVLVGTGLGAAGALVAVGLLGLLVGRRFRGLTDPAAVPALLALFALGSFLALPIENTLSRQVETRADVGALRTTRDLDAFVALQQRLDLSALQDPSPPAWSQFWFGSHPTSLQRIAVAHRVLGTR